MKGQHIISECYQKNFCNENGKIWVLNEKDKIYPSNPKNEFKQKRFYNVEFTSFPEPLIVEKSLSVMESEFVSVVEKIKKKEILNNNDRIALSLFVSSMLIRTKVLRENLKKFFENVLEQAEKMKENNKLIDFIKSIPSSGDKGISIDKLREEIKNFDSYHSLSIIDNMFALAPFVFDLKWKFLITDDNSSFISSDNPVQMSSPEREAKYGTGKIGSLAGLKDYDIELILPLTSKITLFASNKKEAENYLYISPEEVFKINSKIIRSSKKLFANNKEILEFVLEIDKKYPPKSKQNS